MCMSSYDDITVHEHEVAAYAETSIHASMLRK